MPARLSVHVHLQFSFYTFNPIFLIWLYIEQYFVLFGEPQWLQKLAKKLFAPPRFPCKKALPPIKCTSNKCSSSTIGHMLASLPVHGPLLTVRNTSMKTYFLGIVHSMYLFMLKCIKNIKEVGLIWKATWRELAETSRECPNCDKTATEYLQTQHRLSSF